MGKITSIGQAYGSAGWNRLYGPGKFVMTHLANLNIGVKGGQDYSASYRFRAPESGYPAALRLYFQGGSGYAAGNGGIMTFDVRPDVNGVPSFAGQPLGHAVYDVQVENGNIGSIFPLMHFENAGFLEKGKFYHIVHEGIGSQNENYSSTNNSCTTLEHTPARWLNTDDFQVLFGVSAHGRRAYNWRNFTTQGNAGNNSRYAPIFELIYSSGYRLGQANMEGGFTADRLVYTTSKPVREVFWPTSARKISGMSVAVEFSRGGRLKCQLIDSQSGTLVTTYVEQWSPDYTTNASGRSALADFKWRDLEFERDVTIYAGREYHLLMTPENGAEIKIGDAQNGSKHGFGYPASFSESEAQFFDGSWKGYYHWYHGSAGNGGNWPVVLHCAE